MKPLLRPALLLLWFFLPFAGALPAGSVAVQVAGLVDAPVAAPSGFEGLWETTYGRLRLQVDGDQVRGSYASSAASKLEGTIRGSKLEFRYTEADSSGAGTFELGDEGQSLKGRWRAEGSREWAPWTGERVVADPSVRWFVILEARWESGLHEPEYTFGEMLRSYLTLAPEVRVRERRFHDEADFRRFAGEVAFLAEPTVVLVSTHGTPEGLSVGDSEIAPEVIAECLSLASNVELLHLAGCDLMRGTAPERIRAALPQAHRFPISGYTTTVDWAASALADLTYLTFVFLRGRSPEEAVQKTHLASPYTASTAPADCPFVPLGLTILPAAGARRQ